MSDDFFIANTVSMIANEFINNDIQFLYAHVVKRCDTQKIVRYVNHEISLNRLKKGDHPYWSSVAFKKSLIKSPKL